MLTLGLLGMCACVCVVRNTEAGRLGFFEQRPRVGVSWKDVLPAYNANTLS